MSTIICPNCHLRVLPKKDGTCPSCGAITAAEEAAPLNQQTGNFREKPNEATNPKITKPETANKPPESCLRRVAIMIIVIGISILAIFGAIWAITHQNEPIAFAVGMGILLVSIIANAWVFTSISRRVKEKGGLFKKRILPAKSEIAISKNDPNYLICPNCGMEQWKENLNCGKCGISLENAQTRIL